MKRVLILVILSAWTSFSLAQTKPTITVFKKTGASYSSTDIAHKTIPVLAGQRDTFKIKIGEPKGHKNYFSHSDTLMLFVPGRLSFTDASMLNFGLTNISDLTVNSELDSLFVTNDTLAHYIDVSEGYDREDYIEIKDLIIDFPSDLQDEEDFILKASAGFMKTQAADTIMELVTFEYQKPTLSLNKNSTACPGEEVNCTLDITPSDLKYELVKNSIPTGIMVENGDIKAFGYGDVISVSDTGSNNAAGVSNPVTIDDTFFYGINLNFKGGAPTNICEGTKVNIKVGFQGNCTDTISTELYFEVNGSKKEVILSSIPLVVPEAYTYTPPSNGNIVAKVEFDDRVIKKTLEINQFLDNGGINYQLYGGPVSRNHPEMNMLQYLKPAFPHDHVKSLTIDKIRPTSLDYFTNDYADTTTGYTFGRFHFSYNDADYTKDDSIFNPQHDDITYGVSNPNKIIFTYGKYHPNKAVYCIDSVERDVVVSRDKVYIEKDAFCNYDSAVYKAEISTEIERPEVDENHTLKTNYNGYEIWVNDVKKEQNIHDSIYEIIPADLGPSDEITKVEIKALAEIDIYNIQDECPKNWPKNAEVVIYRRDDKVSYLGDEYKCIQDFVIKGNNPPPPNKNWQNIGGCEFVYDGGDLPDEIDPIEVYKRSDSKDSVDVGYAKNIDQDIIHRYNCSYPMWTPNGNPEPVYGIGEEVTFEGGIYECETPAYDYEQPDNSSKWKYKKPCGVDENYASVLYTYASNVFFIYPPADNGKFLNLENDYCIRNDSIRLNCNYAIDTIKNHGESIRRYDNEWYFTPEKLVEGDKYEAATSLRLVYQDDHNCVDSSEHVVKISESYDFNKDFTIENLKLNYCASDIDYELTGVSYSIDSLKGEGVRWDTTANDFYFNPANAVESAYEGGSVELNLRVRDHKQCRYDSTLDINVYAAPQINFDLKNLCDGDSTYFTDTILYDAETDSLWKWEWNFGDRLTLNREGWSDEDMNAHDGNTTGAYGYPVHKYKDPGVYYTTFKVTTDNNCVTQLTDTVIIGKIPEVNFEADGYIEDSLTQFTNNTEYAGYDPVETFTWDFDNNEQEKAIMIPPADTSIMYTSPGVHNVQLEAVTGNGCQSSANQKIPVFPQIIVNNSNHYHENFSDDEHNWLPAHSYDKGLPSGWKLKEIEAPFETQSNLEGRLWHTADPEYDLANERSWVESPCFILDDLEFPLLSVDIYQSVEEGRDGAVIQYSLDDGDSWKLLSSGNAQIDEGLNWYNTSGIVSNPGDQQGTGNIGWSANTKEWHTSRFPLDQVKEQALDSGSRCVRFRMTYSSDGGTAQGSDVEGFAFDNFYITSRSRIVMLEQFVNTVHNKDLQVSEEAWLNDFMETRPVEAVDMRYHNYISHDYDPLYYLNPPDISARSMEYRAMREELTVVDGIHRCLAPAEDSVRVYYNLRTLKDKRFDIDVQTSKSDGALHVTAEVTKLTDTLIYSEGTDQAAVRMALVQKNFEHDGNSYKNIVVELLPDGVGNVVATVPNDFPKGETVTAEGTWHPGVTTIGNEFRLVVYVQGVWGRDEVHQVWFTDLDEELVPRVEIDDPFFDPDAHLTGNLKENTPREIDLYPIPVKDRLNIEWKHALKGTVRWKLISLSGRVIKQKETFGGMTRESINVTDVEDGVYILVMYDEELSRIDKWKIVVAK